MCYLFGAQITKQQPQTECLARLLDILATCTEPLKIENADQNSAA